jgi:hypothetical protein
VAYHSKSEPSPQGALRQSEIPFLGAFFWHGRRETVPRGEVRAVRWMWSASQAVLIPILFYSLCDVWLSLISLYHQFSLTSYVATSTYLWKNMINIILTRPLLPLGQNTDQVELIWTPHHGQHYFRTADRLAFNCSVIFMVRGPDLFLLIREIKPGFVQRNKIFLTVVLDGTQQIQEAFWFSDSGLFLSLW